jgi:hypothetical protein
MEDLVGANDTAFALPLIGSGSADTGEASAPSESMDAEVVVGSGSAPVSRLMVEIGETIQVPERLIQFTVAPVVMAEVLFGILFESLTSLLVPVAVLLVAVAVFVWRERRRPYDVGLAQPPT